MPKVPFTGNVVPIQGGQGPSQTDFWMAAAMMHQEGRLLDLPKPQDKKAPDGPTE